MNNKFVLMCALLFPFIGISQTEEQINEINKSYNSAEISRLKEDFKRKSIQNQKEVEQYAKENNLPIRYRDSLGNLVLMVEIYKGKPLYQTTNTIQAAHSTRTDWLFENQVLNLNLQGENLTAYVWDSGHPRISHQDFENEDATSKITIGEGISEYNLDNHSTHVSGILASTGNNQIRSRGMAKKAQIKAYEFTDAEIEATSETTNGMLVSNHSYGFSSQQIKDGGFSEVVGAYINRSKQWDEIAVNAPYYLPVTSAGNDGNFDFNDDPLDPANPEYDKLSGMKTSKNTLVVANANTASVSPNGDLLSVDINSSSSQGPTDDFRIKPDITGIGTQVFSTTSGADDAYGYLTGTSMSSPNVAGTLLLLQELYEGEHGNFMRAATLKALVLHTADDAGMAGPDAIYGWGLLNAKKAAEEIQNKTVDKSIIIEDVLLESQTYTLNVDANQIDDLEISISWTDPAGTLSTTANDPSPILVNDLNLKVSQNTTDYFPWKLTGVNTNTTGVNNVDPFEKIEIANANGQYTIEVTHAGSLTNGEQNFTLIVTGVSPNTVICCPTQNLAETSIDGTSHDFSWDASPDETNGYNWAIVEAGKNPDDHQIIQEGTLGTGTTSLSATNLSPATNYSFFVKTNCTSEASDWNKIAFKTPCGTLDLFPFKEDFTSSSASYDCWSVDASTSAFWAPFNSGTNFGSVRSPYSGNRNMVFVPNGTEELGFVSPYFDVSSFGNVQLQFFIVQQEDAGNQNEMKVFFEEQGSSPVEIAHLTATYSDWTEITLPLTTTSTPYRIILKGISKSGPMSAIDHFRILYDGYHFQDWVWTPKNPENEVSTLTDDIWVENKTATLHKKTLAKSIQIETNSILAIADILEIYENITGDGLLKFLNNETQLGQIATLPILSSISVETQVERWIPAGIQNTRAFRMLSSPVSSTSSIYANWQENGNQPQAFGTHITGSQTGLNGFDATVTGNPSMYWFDHAETNQSGGAAWTEIDNTDVNTISAGNPYRLLIRGDRTIDLSTNSPTPTNTKLRTHGNLFVGDFSPNLASGNEQFSFVGNPYQAIVDPNLLSFSGDINSNYIYVWDPNLNTHGGFVSVEIATGDHATTSEANQFIQPGQAVFIRNNLNVSTTPSITFTESSKNVNQNATQVFSNTEFNEEINLKLVNSQGEVDAIGLRFNETFNNAFTDADAGKMGNANENLAIIGNNQLWSITKRQHLLHEESIPLFINNYTETHYAFVPEITFYESEVTYFLKDHFTDALVELQNASPIPFEVDNASPESASAFRFEIVAETTTLADENFNASEINLYPNPASDFLHIEIPNTSNPHSIEVFDVLGKSVYQKEITSSENEINLDVSSFSVGTYVLKLKSDTNQWTQKFIKK